MEPLTTIIFLASLTGVSVGAPSTLRPNWTNEKKARTSTPTISTDVDSLLKAKNHTKTALDITGVTFDNIASNKSFISNVYSELESYLSLTNGWDGVGSIAPKEHDVARALALIGSLPSSFPLPTPMVSPNGELGLYWDTGANYADINFEPDGKISLYSRSRASPEIEKFIDGIDVTQLTNSWYFDELGDVFLPRKLVA